jgi:hypothetical protein
MKRLLYAAAAALATTAPAAAQESVTLTLDWLEVVGGTSTPVANPNGMLEPAVGAPFDHGADHAAHRLTSDLLTAPFARHRNDRRTKRHLS